MNSRQEYLRAVKLLPPSLREYALEVSYEIAAKAEEIRLRAGQPLSFVVGDSERETEEDYAVKPNELQFVLEIATRASAHSYADSIRMGFVTAEGGCRVGLCGTAITDNDTITGIRRISSICIRIPREKQGCADGVFEALSTGGFESVLILSPPGDGKTTMLRELTRLISDGGTRIALVDERNEVAGSHEGQPCFDIGRRTDVLTGAPKAEGVMMVLRSMAPQIIAFDEITAPEDVQAAYLAANCGVKLLATAHAESVDDLKRRPLYRRMLESGIFRRAVVIENLNGERRYTVEELA